ncbi:hypothetical protein CCMSSC00406_0007025 [Pleurotus cornucopiae]|uniref:Uncharacterized protein n=1 Tax=Pleurotus cornucopiae TaxID=5321 RepID=A0ACB7J3P9_PLECO|nr:hypothetical protein CCMSSC00406_0007025 [Pleurotus cornucopiae]
MLLWKTPSLLLAALLSFTHAARTTEPIIDLGYARYRGSINDTTSVTSYLGIRFAEPPVEDLRWRAPQPAKRLPGVQNATIVPPLCPQGFINISIPGGIPPPDLTNVSEDCLFLSVFAPRKLPPKRKELPVIVWIHGGGYIVSSAATFDGTNLVRESNDSVIVVTIQYRLGIFGFMAGKKLKDNGDLNAGLLDQELALKWVQQHINKFGGDPKQVTIWGQSAGGGSVLQQVIAHNGQTNPPLFRAAMSSSTYLPSQHHFDDPVPEGIYSTVVSTAGCADATDPLTCLRASNTSILQAANDKACRSAFYGTSVVVPVVDGEFITQRPSEALRQRRVNGNALLAISNTNEGDIFVDQSKADTVTAAQFVRDLYPRLNGAQVAEVVRLYSGLGAPIQQADSIMSDTLFQCPTIWFSQAFRQSFKGEYAVLPAFHGSDISQYFPSFAPRFFDDPAFTSSFTQSFLDFALSRNSDPNAKFDDGNSTPRWNRYTSCSNFEMVFNRTDEEELDIRPASTGAGLLERCAFWESVRELTAQ